MDHPLEGCIHENNEEAVRNQDQTEQIYQIRNYSNSPIYVQTPEIPDDEYKSEDSEQRQADEDLVQIDIRKKSVSQNQLEPVSDNQTDFNKPRSGGIQSLRAGNEGKSEVGILENARNTERDFQNSQNIPPLSPKPTSQYMY